MATPGRKFPSTLGRRVAEMVVEQITLKRQGVIDVTTIRAEGTSTDQDTITTIMVELSRDDPEDMLASSMEDMEAWEAEHGGTSDDAS